jgi:hypothetical protein
MRSLPSLNHPVDAWLDTALTAFNFVWRVNHGMGLK